jgi:kinesin family protein 4/21/27
VNIKGSNESFTYDYVFDQDDSQSQVYDTAVTNIVGKIFMGYNVTILAYGQTGSGKTFTMGTADSTSSASSENLSQSGIIQRAIFDLFENFEKMAKDGSISFKINVSFLEVLCFNFSFELLELNFFVF